MKKEVDLASVVYVERRAAELAKWKRRSAMVLIMLISSSYLVMIGGTSQSRGWLFGKLVSMLVLVFAAISFGWYCKRKWEPLDKEMKQLFEVKDVKRILYFVPMAGPCESKSSIEYDLMPAILHASEAGISPTPELTVSLVSMITRNKNFANQYVLFSKEEIEQILNFVSTADIPQEAMHKLRLRAGLLEGIPGYSEIINRSSTLPT